MKPPGHLRCGVLPHVVYLGRRGYRLL